MPSERRSGPEWRTINELAAAAAMTLGAIGPNTRAAIPLLRESLKHESHVVRGAAEAALKSLTKDT